MINIDEGRASPHAMRAISELEKRGFSFHRKGSGDHHIYKHPDGRTVPVDMRSKNQHHWKKVVRDTGERNVR